VDSHLIAYPQSSGDLINNIYPSHTSAASHSQAYLPTPRVTYTIREKLYNNSNSNTLITNIISQRYALPLHISPISILAPSLDSSSICNRHLGHEPLQSSPRRQTSSRTAIPTISISTTTSHGFLTGIQPIHRPIPWPESSIHICHSPSTATIASRRRSSKVLFTINLKLIRTG
jgi:hypothetical protein